VEDDCSCVALWHERSGLKSSALASSSSAFAFCFEIVPSGGR
jgi:hypothetical protein